MFFKKKNTNKIIQKKDEFLPIEGADEYLWEAAKIVVKHKMGSIGVLQRELKIGFNRALNIMDELCKMGIVGEEVAGKAFRDVLVDENRLKEISEKSQNMKLPILKEESQNQKEEKEFEKTREYIYPPLALLRKRIEPINSEGSSVSFREVVESAEYIMSPSHISFAIGKDIDGKAVVSNITDFPQMIISDNAKSSRMACLNLMIMSIIYKASPDAVKMILIDTREWLGIYNGIPHLLVPVVTNIQKSFAALKWTISESNNRAKQFKDLGVKNITEYNISEKIQHRMPIILVFINDFTDLLSEYGKEAKEIVDNITQLASKMGIYPIIAETNFSYTISVGINIEHEKQFYIAPSIDLMKKDEKSIFVQEAFVSNEEIFSVVDFLLAQCKNKQEVIRSEQIAYSPSSNRVNMYNNKYDYMTGEDFEVFVSQILKKIGFYNIQLTKGSGDQGVDILAEKDGIKYAIQCKRYSQPVGNKAVQEVFAGKTFYRCHVGAVVTNNYFTQSAKDLARENGIVLWDKDFLDKHIDLKAENKIQKSPDSIIEKYYYINEDFTTFSLKAGNKIEILGICKDRIKAANLYLSLYIKLKEEWLGKFDFAVAVNFGEAVAIATNENGVEFFGGKELNGAMAIGIPDWMDKARDEFLNGNEDDVMKMIEESRGCLDEFMEIAVKYMQ